MSKGTNTVFMKDKPSKLNKKTKKQQMTIIKTPILMEIPNSSINMAPEPETITLKPVYREKAIRVSIINPSLLPKTKAANWLKSLILLLYIFISNKEPNTEKRSPDTIIPTIPLRP